MRALFKDAILILVADSDEERSHVRDFVDKRKSHVFVLAERHDRAIALRDLGPREEACREPVDIGSHAKAAYALISNLAATPFELAARDGFAPLRHRTRRDSESIPGVIMADIWMRVRERIRSH
jgi:hypothetical protein